jgi:hypothetical protein
MLQETAARHREAFISALFTGDASLDLPMGLLTAKTHNYDVYMGKEEEQAIACSLAEHRRQPGVLHSGFPKYSWRTCLRYYQE